MTINAENLAKAWIFQVRISKENWFSRCFLSLKLVLNHLSFFPSTKWLLLPFYVQGFMLQQVKTTYFRCSEKGFSLQRVGSNCSCLYLILRFTAAASFFLAVATMVFSATRLAFATMTTPYLDSSIYIHFGAFQLLLCIFKAFVTCMKNR